MSIFWPKKWSRSLKKFEFWLLTRELLQQYLTEKRNGCLPGGRLREVVAMRDVDCSLTSAENLVETLNDYGKISGLKLKASKTKQYG